MKSLIREVKPYTHRELSGYYGVCDKTLKKWLSPFQDQIGKKNGRYYTVVQVKIILEKIGVPSIYEELGPQLHTGIVMLLVSMFDTYMPITA